jgi:T-complex protein 1 subunit theta
MQSAGGLPSMLKHGASTASGVQDAIIRNLEACEALTSITRTSLGPNGMNKLVQNHIGKTYVTSDCATMLAQMDVNHPAAKMLRLASEMQEQEVGDGTNLVCTFGGEILTKAQKLLRMGLKPVEITTGYTMATRKALEILESSSYESVKDVRNLAEVTPLMHTVMSSKNVDSSLADWVAKGCIASNPLSGRFHVGNVRVATILGSGMADTFMLPGLATTRCTKSRTSIKSVEDARVGVFVNPLDIDNTDSKGNVLMKNADELKNYNKSEEAFMEEQVKAIADSGVNVCVFGGKCSDLALHYLERYGQMVIVTQSKFELRRICDVVKATSQMRAGAVKPSEIGRCANVSEVEYGGSTVMNFRATEGETAAMSTIIVRASSQSLLEDSERAINDGVNVYRQLCRDPRLVPGGAAMEMQLARQVADYADTIPGLEQYAIRAYAEAFEIIASSLAKNSGRTGTDVVADLYAHHNAGRLTMGVNVEMENPETCADMAEMGVWDCLATKETALHLIMNTSVDILRVDTIIMARQAGGPKPKGPNKNWDKDPIFG